MVMPVTKTGTRLQHHGERKSEKERERERLYCFMKESIGSKNKKSHLFRETRNKVQRTTESKRRKSKITIKEKKKH